MIRRTPLAVCCLLCGLGSPGRAGAGGAEPALEAVRAALPRQPLRIGGELQTLNRFGDIESRMDVELALRWGDEPPAALFVLRDAFGREIERLAVAYPLGAKPRRTFARGDPPEPAPLPDRASPLGNTAFTWGDLALDFLWWPEARDAGQERIRGRECRLLEVRPGAADASPYAFVRLWIDDEADVLLRAEGYDETGALVRRLTVQSFRKIDGLWTIGHLDVEQFPDRRRTRLRVRTADLED